MPGRAMRPSSNHHRLNADGPVVAASVAPMRFDWYQVCVGLVLVMAACAAPPALESPHEFAVAVPTFGTGFYEREFVAEVQSAQRAELRARIKGLIEQVAVDEGQSVKSGQLLFSISARELHQELRRARAEVASAAAHLKAAELEQANLQALFEKNVVSPAEMAQLAAKTTSLAAQLEVAQAIEGQASVNLTYAEVRAPFSGVVNRIPMKVGNVATEGDLLTTLTNTNEVFVYFRVSETDYLEYLAKSAGQSREVSFRIANGELHTKTGMTDAVEAEFDRSTGTIAIRARFPNDNHILKHGSTGKVIVKSELKDSLLIPQKSTFEIQEQVYVYIVDEESKARARRIVPKLRLRESFVVESGIEAGERFIFEGVQKVKEGEKIIARLESPTTGTTALEPR
jgi:RND family efflux transporter MFP subunit